MRRSTYHPLPILFAAILLLVFACQATPQPPRQPERTRHVPATLPAHATPTIASRPIPTPRPRPTLPFPTSTGSPHQVPVTPAVEPTRPSTPEPTVTPTQPTPTTAPTSPVDTEQQLDAAQRDEILNAYASCHQRYQGDQAARRRSAALRAIEHGQYTYREIQAVTNIHCTPPSPDPTPAPTPSQSTRPTPHPSTPTRQAAQPTPAPSGVPLPDWRTPARARHPTLASAIDARDWPHQGNDHAEATAALHLVILADVTSSEFAASVLSMPFLDVPTPADAAAVHGLHIAARAHPSDMRSIIANHPELEGGIKDPQAGRIAVLPTTLSIDAELAHRLLEASAPAPQRRTIRVGDSQVHLEIVRDQSIRPDDTYALDTMEHAIAYLTELMGRAPPTSFFALVFAPGASGAPGTYHHSHLAIHPRYDVASRDANARAAATLVTHELAHYWWHGNRSWLDEGIAVTIALLSQSRTDPATPPCQQYRGIRELEEANPPVGHPHFPCNYSLGSDLFLEIYRDAGAAAFKTGYQRLHSASRSAPAGIHQVRSAFPDSADIIDRHYDGQADDTSPLPPDTSPTDPDLPQVNGRINSFHTSLRKDGPAIQEFSAQQHHQAVFLTIDYDFDFQGAPVEIAVDIVAVYQDGNTVFRHQADLLCDERYSGATHAVSFEPTDTQWRPGRYDLYVYRDGQKAAQASFTVTP